MSPVRQRVMAKQDSRGRREESSSGIGQAYGGGRPRPVHEEIARLAHEIYRKRGAAHGDDWADWFRAEAILKAGSR